MVEEGLGYAVGLDKIINTSRKSSLCMPAFSKARSGHAYHFEKISGIFQSIRKVYREAKTMLSIYRLFATIICLKVF